MTTKPTMPAGEGTTAACTMPEHGHPDASAPCCRPTPPAIGGATGPSPDHRRATGSWRDADTWRRAARNTAHCLLGCAIGDILAMTLVPLAWPTVALPVLMAIAIVAGIVSSLALETLVLRRRERMSWRQALRVAWGMSLISMVAMELAMNITDWLMMGGTRMPIAHPGYWLAWLPALLVGFLAPLPYNYARLRQHGRSCH